jgi:hypothetical protein
MNAQLSQELVWSRIVARAWCDQDFMRRLLSDPRAVLSEHEVEVPARTEVEVVLGPQVAVLDTDTGRRFMLPATPPDELIEEELTGDTAPYCGCGVCGRCGACGCRCRC